MVRARGLGLEGMDLGEMVFAALHAHPEHDTRAHLYDGGPFAQGQILLREEKRIVQTCFGIRFSGFGVSGSGFRFRILSKYGQVSGFQVDRVSGIR